MDRLLQFGALLLLLSRFEFSECVQQRFIEEPASVSVHEGENVLLSCSVDNKMGVLQWTKDDFGLGVSRELSEYNRYQMVGEEGREWNLLINNATIDDDAKYQCQVGATDTMEPIRSRYALVRVMSPPQPPVLTAGPSLSLRQGKVALIQCISKGGKPASVIKWRRNGDLINEGVLEKVEKLNESSRFMTVSTLTFPISANMTRDILECEAIHEAQPVSRTVSTQLSVEFAPSVSLAVDKETIYEGDSVKLTCTAKAHPDLIEYRWSLDDEEIMEGRGAKEVVMTVDRSFNKKHVACFARNSIGENMASYTLDVKYSPVFKTVPADVIGDLGDKVSLECGADSNPEAQYQWSLGDVEKTSGPSINIELTNTSTGTYSCQASVAGFPSIRHSVHVRMRGPPKILMEQSTQFSSVGETVHVICEAESVPAAKTFSWTFNGTPLRSSQSFSMIETQHGASVRSTVIISDSKKHHFGDYKCSVSNEIGTSESTITLLEKESLPLLIIISASIGGSLLAIVIIVIALTWRRVASKKNRKSDSTAAKNAWPGAAHQIQPDRFSNSSSDSNMQSSNTTSSVSTVEDLEASDILQEFQRANNFSRTSQSNYIKNNSNYGDDYSSSSEFRQFRSEHDLLDHAAKYNSDYHNPYLQTITPTREVFNSPGHLSPSYRNFAPLSMSSVRQHREDNRHQRDERSGQYESGRGRRTPTPLYQHHDHLSVNLSEQLNQSAIGTHV